MCFFCYLCFCRSSKPCLDGGNGNGDILTSTATRRPSNLAVIDRHNLSEKTPLLKTHTHAHPDSQYNANSTFATQLCDVMGSKKPEERREKIFYFEPDFSESELSCDQEREGRSCSDEELRYQQSGDHVSKNL